MTLVFSIIKLVSIMDTSETELQMIIRIDSKSELGYLFLSLCWSRAALSLIKNKKNTLQVCNNMQQMHEHARAISPVNYLKLAKRSSVLHTGKYSINRLTERKMDRGKATYVGLPARVVGSGSGKEDKGIFFFLQQDKQYCSQILLCSSCQLQARISGEECC